MKGVRFVIDNKGRKTAVLIDLKKWGKLWEDFYDIMVLESRKHEPTIPFKDLKPKIRRRKQS